MEKNMQTNFEYLYERVIDTNRVSDLKKIREKLVSIKGNTICVGAGGSGVVSDYLSKVLSQKNNILCLTGEPRDILYQSLTNIRNIIVCSYSGANYGVEVTKRNDLNHYVLSNNNTLGEIGICYSNTIDKEKSFISLASTLMPMSILLNYYLDGKDFDEMLVDMFNNIKMDISSNNVFEIFSGAETSTPAKFLESTMIESGMALPIVHSKYDFCHGRSTIAYKNNHSMIYINNANNDLDQVIINSPDYIEKVQINSRYGDNVIDNFYLTIQAMFLAKSLAEKKGIDLSKVEYNPLVKKLYRFDGKM